MQFSLQRKEVRGRVVLISLCLLFFLISLSTAFAANYTPLVGIPGLQNAQGAGLASYLNRLYVITIGIGAILAFIKIAMAGVKWSMSDVVTDKGAAKEDIKGALLGLAILLIPFIVLNTIYPGLTSLNILGNAGSSRVDLNVSSTPSPATATNGTLVQPGDVITNKTVWEHVCTDIGSSLIPGTENDVSGPQYYPASYDCSTQQADCGGPSYNGTSLVINNNTAVRCTYFVSTVCDPLAGVACSGGTFP
jgi:hypothetical protein